ncbi:MAG: hypothetical protein EOO14_01300 [Chitinophagaceae bacterium]|nr:MAG: hypothetical protein EOO14_01300 [Chitinophagaceae bacterium]
MNQALYYEAQIDVAEIFEFELERLREGRNDEAFFKELRESLIPFYILKKHEPFVSQAAVAAGTSSEKYYYGYEERLKSQASWNLDYFKFRDAFYDYNLSCIVEKEDVIQELYSWLFALKVRQFEAYKEEFSSFLGYHYHVTFNGDKQEYALFLQSLLRYKDLIAPSLREEIITVAKEVDTLPRRTDYIETISNRPTWEEFKALSLEAAPNTSVSTKVQGNGEEEIGVEEQPIKEQGTTEATAYAIQNTSVLSKEEIDHFFAFLYKDRGDEEGSYLKKEEVEIMLQYGITIPAQPLQEKFKLNYTARYSKKLAEYLLHAFIVEYNRNEKGKFLQFLGSYIQDYELALSAQGLRNISKNFTGDRPSKRNILFKLEDFLPKNPQ